MLNNIKNSKQTGFTIVELLIVIVVIAILAAISIVAYNGIQARGKTSAGQSLASQVAKKAEAFNTIESTYPTHAVFIANTGSGAANHPNEAKLDNPGAVLPSGPAAANDGKAVSYVGQHAGGACVGYWDFAPSTGSPRVMYITVGAGDTGALC